MTFNEIKEITLSDFLKSEYRTIKIHFKTKYNRVSFLLFFISNKTMQIFRLQ